MYGATIGAHRVAYEWAHGPINAWLEVDHTCRRPLCVNPSHMEAVTHLENVRRGKTAEFMRSIDHPLANYLFEKEISVRDFAARMLVSPDLISRMLRGARPSDPEAVYRVGAAIGLDWEQTDLAFPRRMLTR